MKKLVAGASLALGLAGGVAEVRPAAADTHLCVDIYDETAELGASPELSQAIGELAASGTDVHVQILKDGTDDGIIETYDTEAFADDLAVTCAWNDVSRVNIIVSDKPRAYDVFTVGKIDNEISEGEASDVIDDFVGNLQDRSTPYQSDVAEALQDLSEAALTSAPENAGPRTPSEPLNIPFAKIGIGLGAVVALGGAGSRVKRGHDIKKEFKTAVSNADSKIFETTTVAEQQVDGLHADDAPELRSHVVSGKDAINELIASREAAAKAYREERFRIWPSLTAVSDRVDEFETTAEKASSVHEMLKTELEQIQGFITEIDEMTDELKTSMNDINTAAAELQAQGWDISGAQKQLADLKAQYDQVLKLRAEHYVEKPAEMIHALLPKFTETRDWLVNLPSVRAEADQDFDSQPERIEQASATITAALQTIKSLRAGYDKSCLTGITTHDTVLNEKLALINQIHASGAQTRGKEDYDALQESIGLNATFASTTAEINSLSEEIADRAARLEDLKANLPSAIAGIDEQHAAAHQYAYEDHAADVEDDTRESIQTIAKDLFEIKADLGVDKPAYLEIDETVQGTSQKLEAAMKRAQAQKAEMDELRRDSERFEQEIKNDLANLQTYISSHSGDITSTVESSANSINIFAANTSLGREALRNQINRYETLENQISNERERAESMVRAAEQERQRQAELKRQEQEAQRQRDAANRNSGGFGGGRNSGGFGGGHRSGGF